MLPCPDGHFCPDGTGINWLPCPLGTYNNETGLGSLTECKPCPGGEYCMFTGASNPTGACDGGYYCEYGLDRARPTGGYNATIINGTCVLPGKI